MLSDDKTYLIYIVLAIILPMIPAYVLYRTLPSKTFVKGPFKGLNVQLSGAFGGYFLVLLIMYGFVLLRPKPPALRPFKVHGRLTGVPQETIGDLVKSIVVRPAGRQWSPDGSFDLEIMVKVDPITRQFAFPNLIIEREGYDSVTVPLDGATPDYEVERDQVPGLITIKTAISLRKRYDQQPYNEAEPP